MCVCVWCIGLNIDGLYRIPGKAMEILEIKKQFDNGKEKVDSI